MLPQADAGRLNLAPDVADRHSASAQSHPWHCDSKTQVPRLQHAAPWGGGQGQAPNLASTTLERLEMSWEYALDAETLMAPLGSHPGQDVLHASPNQTAAQSESSLHDAS